MALIFNLEVLLGEKMWTQKQLCKAANLRPMTVNNMYHNITRKVDLDQLEKICKALECSISDILVEEKKPKKKVNPYST